MLINQSGKVALKPLDGLVLLNGVELSQQMDLNHQDRYD
jgi:hypothetical protein